MYHLSLQVVLLRMIYGTSTAIANAFALFGGRRFYYEWLTEQREANCREPAFSGGDILPGLPYKCFVNYLSIFSWPNILKLN